EEYLDQRLRCARGRIERQCANLFERAARGYQNAADAVFRGHGDFWDEPQTGYALALNRRDQGDFALSRPEHLGAPRRRLVPDDVVLFTEMTLSEAVNYGPIFQIG